MTTPSNDKEIADRLRRIETRLTRYLRSRGFDTQTEEPRFKRGELTVPSRACSLNACLHAIPPDWIGPVKVMIGREQLCTLTVGDMQ